MLVAGGPSPCAVLALVVLEEFVGRNRHHDLARLVLHEIGEREHRDIADPADKADENQKSEQARHDRDPAAARAKRANFACVGRFGKTRPRGCLHCWYMEPWRRFGTLAWLTVPFKKRRKTARNRRSCARSGPVPSCWSA